MPIVKKTSLPLRDRVRAVRARKTQQGLRPIQFWVQDVRRASFKTDARRQSLAVATSKSARGDQAFVDAISDWGNT